MPDKKAASGLISGSIMVTFARVVSSACAFALFWFISQKSIGQLGAFRTLFVYFLVAEFIPLLGMNQYVIREISRKKEDINDYLLHSFIFSLFVSIIMAASILVISFYGRYSPVVAKGLLIIIAGIPATAAVICYQSALVASGKGAELGIIQGLEAVARTVTGFILISCTHDILYVIAGFIIFRWLITCVYWRQITPMTSRYKWRINTKFFKSFLKAAPQFAGILTLFLIIRFAGQLMVPWMEGDIAAGYFAIVYQFLDLILLVPTAFAINLMPVLSRKTERGLPDLNKTCKQAMKLISIFIIPCTLFVFINCKSIIFLIFGVKYQPTVLLVSISIWAGLILSLDQVLSTSMISAGKQGADLASLAIGALITTGTMYFLISGNGVVGAATGLLIGTLTLFITRVIIYNTKMSFFNLPVILWRQIVGGLIMAGSMFLLKSNIIISGFIGGVLYILTLFCLGCFNKNERAFYLELFKNN